MPNQNTDQREQETTLTKVRLKRPPRYQVIMLNDNTTPQLFVVELLKLVFHLDPVKATKIMLRIHTKGSGVCGVYPFEIAEVKTSSVHNHARSHKYPLRCRMEPE